MVLNYNTVRRDGLAAGGAIDETITLSRAVRLEEIRVKLGAAGSSHNLTITMDHPAGAAYDFVIYSQNVNGLTDFTASLNDGAGLFVPAGAALNVAYSNPPTARDWAFELVFVEL
jgi:hypothetical protein